MKLLRLSCENAGSSNNDPCAFAANQPHVIPWVIDCQSDCFRKTPVSWGCNLLIQPL